MRVLLLIAFFVCVFALAFAQENETQAVAAAPVVAASAKAALKKINAKYSPSSTKVNAAWKKEFAAPQLQEVRNINQQILKLKTERKTIKTQLKEVKTAYKNLKKSNKNFLALERHALSLKNKKKRQTFLATIEKKRSATVSQRKTLKKKFKALVSKSKYTKKVIKGLRAQRKVAYKKAVAWVVMQKTIYSKMINAQYQRLFDLTAELGKAAIAKDATKAASLQTDLTAARKRLVEIKAQSKSQGLASTFFKKEAATEAANKKNRAAKRAAKKLALKNASKALKAQLVANKKNKKVAKQIKKKLKAAQKKLKKFRAAKLKKQIRNFGVKIRNYKKLLKKAKAAKNVAVIKTVKKTIAAIKAKVAATKKAVKKITPNKCINVGGKKQCNLTVKYLPSGKFYCKRSLFRSVCFQCDATKTVGIQVKTKKSAVTVTKKTGKCTKVTTYVPAKAVKIIKTAAYNKLAADKTVTKGKKLSRRALRKLVRKNRAVRSKFNNALKSLLSLAEYQKVIAENPLKLKKIVYGSAKKVYTAKLSKKTLAAIKANKNSKVAVKAALSKIVKNIKKAKGVVKKVVKPTKKPVVLQNKPVIRKGKKIIKKKVVKKAVVKKVVKKAAVAKKIVKKIVKKSNGVTVIRKTYKVKSCKKNCGPRIVKMKITLGPVKCPKRK